MYDLIVAGSDGQANFLALNQGDNWLHLFSAFAGLAIALWPARDRHVADTPATRGGGRAR